MPDVHAASIDFLADLDLYNHEKPFVALASPGVKIRDDQLNNLQWETNDNVTIRDVRGFEDRFVLDDCGFQLIKHSTQSLEFSTADHINDYRHETQNLLNSLLGNSRVRCWEARVR